MAWKNSNKLIFISLTTLFSVVQAQEMTDDLDEKPTQKWSHSTVEHEGESYFRSFVKSNNGSSLFAVDLAQKDCQTHIFKNFFVKSPETNFEYTAGTFFSFSSQQQDQEKMMFSKSEVKGNEGEELSFSRHQLWGISNDLNIFFSLLENNDTMDVYFSTPYGNSYSFSFTLDEAINALMENLEKCQTQKGGSL